MIAPDMQRRVKSMSYKAVAIFQVIPGNTKEELRRTKLALEILEEQPGFVSYESIRTDENNVVVIQGCQ
jgi:heme-degrading monooxygenase HmoA